MKKKFKPLFLNSQNLAIASLLFLIFSPGTLNCIMHAFLKTEHSALPAFQAFSNQFHTIHSNEKDTICAGIIERYIGNEAYFEFFDSNMNVIKLVRKSKFIEDVPSKYALAFLKSDTVAANSAIKGYAEIGKFDITKKRVILNQVLTTLPEDNVINSIQTISTYGGPGAYICFGKFILYHSSVSFTGNENWSSPCWSETTVVIYDNLNKIVGRIVTNKLLENITISSDGRYLIGEIHTFSIEGDDGIEGFNLYDVLNGRLVYHLPYIRKNGTAENIEYENGLFNISIRTWDNDKRYWRFCIDPYNSIVYKKLYDPSDKEWGDIKFMRFKNKKHPNGLKENLSTYELAKF